MFLGFFVGAETMEADDVLVVRDALNGTSEMSTGKCFEFFCFICIFLEKKQQISVYLQSRQWWKNPTSDYRQWWKNLKHQWSILTFLHI